MKRITVFLAILLSSCTTVTTDEEWDRVTTLSQQVGQELYWNRNQGNINYLIKKELRNPLTLESAQRIAFLNNPHLQAKFEDIGIAKADLVGAGFWQNPDLGALIKFPLPGAGVLVEAAGLFHLSDLWQIPYKKEVALAFLDKTIYEVAIAIQMTKRDVTLDYLNLVHQMRVYELKKEDVQLLEKKVKEAQKDHEWGYFTKPEVENIKIALHQQHIELTQQELALFDVKLKLLKTLGLEGEVCSIANVVPYSNIKTIHSANRLVMKAWQQRLDLKAAEAGVVGKCRKVGLEKSMVWRVLGGGVAYEHETDGKSLLGPAFSLEFPIFHQNQAEIAKAQFSLRKSQKEYRMLKLQIEKKVRTYWKQLHLNAKLLRIMEDNILTLQKSIKSFKKSWKEKMQITPLDLIQTKKNIIETNLKIENILYEMAKLEAELEFEVGGGLIKKNK